MHRIIFSIGNFHLYSYGLMMAIAFIVGLFVSVYISKKENIEKDIITDLAMWIIGGAIIGARLWFVIENFEYFNNDLLGIVRIWEGGMVFYGGFLGGVLGGIFYLKKHKLSIPLFADIMIPGFAIGISIGRIGCFLNGCCYGKVCNSGHFCVEFPAKDFPPPYYDQLKSGLINPHATHSLPVIPTQLIASSIAFFIFLILFFIYKKKLFNGFILSIFLILYGLDRFFLDFLRYYSPDAMRFGFISLSQITSLFLIAFGVFYIIKNVFFIKKDNET